MELISDHGAGTNFKIKIERIERINFLVRIKG